MSDTVKKNTRWIEVWIINDEDWYWQAREVAHEAEEAGDYGILRDYVKGILQAGDTETTRAVSREMSDADYDRTDWAEVASTLLSD